MKNMMIHLLVSAGLLVAGCDKGTPTVFSVELNPENSEVLFMATMTGVFKSRDGGVTWESRSEGLSGAHVISIVIDPGSPSTILAGTFGDAIYKTMDGGQHWNPSNIGLKGHVSVVNAFAFYKKEPNVIFAGTTIGPYKSVDGGKEWEERVSGMESVYVVSMVFDPFQEKVLFAGTSGGVYRSDDLGEHWVFKHDGMIKVQKESAMSIGVNGFLVDPVRVGILYAGTSRGLFKSVNGGNHWTEEGKEIGAQFIIALGMESATGVIYAGTNSGVFKSTDGGKTWVLKNQGLKSTVIRSIAVDRNHPGVVYVGTQKGLYKTTTGGEQWNLLKGYYKEALALQDRLRGAGASEDFETAKPDVPPNLIIRETVGVVK